MSYYRNQLEAWLQTISVKTEKVLDLGGASNPVRKRVKSWDVQECFFMDNGAENPVVDFLPFDINLPLEKQLPGYEKLLKDPWNQTDASKALEELHRPFKFNAVFCLEVFEYVWNPVQAIQNIWDLMSPDSVVYISFPAIYPVHEPYKIDFLRYTKEAIMHYLSLLPFQQIEIVPRIATVGKGDLQRFYSNEGMHPLRGSELPYDIGYLVKARKLTLV